MPTRVLLLLLAAMPLCSADRFDPVRDFIRKGLVDTGVASVAVAVAKDGKVIWEEGFGWANREKRVRASEHTLYSLASISKPITATGLMLLVERGKIGLDQPVNHYLGEAKIRGRAGDAAQATVRRVANHSSGLPLHVHFFFSDQPRRPPSMDETILRYAQLVTAPGERFQYSNLGFGILDYVIERVSGQPYADFMRQEVFLPLGLTHTSVHIGPGLEEYAAARYGASGAPIPFYEFDHTGASAVWSSAHDLVRFGMFHLKNRLPEQKPILSDASLDAMKQPTFSSGPGVGYGVAWNVADVSGGYRVVSHTGAMGGVATTLRLVESENLAVVVLCNGSDPLPHRTADEIFKVMLPNWRPEARQPAAAPSAFQPPRELVGVWTGRIATYRGEIPFTLRVLETGDIHAQLEGQLKTLVNEARWNNGYLSGVTLGDLRTEDTGGGPVSLRLLLKLRGNVLNGSATAAAPPGRSVPFTLTHWVELTRQ